MSEGRNQRKVYQGRVVSDKMDKTITVVVETYVNHKVYGKRVKYSKKYKAHDENNEAKVGDIVKIMETRPLSATKRFRLLEIVEKAVIYLFGAYLYNLRPINVVGVMEAIKSNAPYTNFIKNQSAQNLINLSYFNWTYILCSIAISVLVILLLHKTKQKSNKG